METKISVFSSAALRGASNLAAQERSILREAFAARSKVAKAGSSFPKTPVKGKMQTQKKGK